MPIKDLSFTCSQCGKPVLGAGWFLYGPGGKDGFCDIRCLQAWTNEIVQKIQKPKPKSPSSQKSKKPG